MSQDLQQKIPFSPQGNSQQGGFGTTSQSPVQYDWIDVVRQQNSRLVQNQERQKQLEQNRKQKYREILEQEINERDAQKKLIQEAKKQEHDEVEKNISIVDKYDEEKKIQKKQVERQIQEQNKQLIAEKKMIEKETKNRQIEQTLNSYTQNNLIIQRQVEEENQQKIQRQREFLNQLENQKKQNQDLKNVQRTNIAQEEQSYMNHLSNEEQLRRNDRDKIRYGYQAEKPTVYQQIDLAYREKEQKMQTFENHFVNEGLQQQLQREKKMQDLIKQGRKQLQQQVDQIVGDQLDQKKQVQVYNVTHKYDERSQADQNFQNYKNAEQQRKANQRELYQRQNFINEQQQQLKGQLKERQRHMNDNEIKINLDKLPESPSNLPKSSSTMFYNGKPGQIGQQSKANLIYMGDYVSYDRQKQLQYVDSDLQEKMPIQQEQYKRTVLNKSSASIPQIKEPSLHQFPKAQSPDSSHNQQILSHRSNNKNKYDLYLQQTKFPRNNAFTNNQSPPQIMVTSPTYPIENMRQNQYENNNIQQQHQQYQGGQPLNYTQQYRHQSSPQLQEQQVYQQQPQKQEYQQQNNQNIPQYQSQENIYYPPQQQMPQIPQQQNKVIQPLSGVSNVINLEKQQQQQPYEQQSQQNKRNTQPIIQQSNQKQDLQRSLQNPNNQSVQKEQNPPRQIMSPNNFYDKFNYNIQNKNTQNIPPPPMQATFKGFTQVPINGEQNQRKSNKEFNIKSIQYNNTIADPIGSSNNKMPNENMIRVYRSPQNIQSMHNQQNYHIPQMNRYQGQSTQQLNGGSMNSHTNNNYGGNRGGINSSMSNSMNFIENRSNILSSQRQDYNQIRQSNANWAQRGFNIITGGN